MRTDPKKGGPKSGGAAPGKGATPSPAGAKASNTKGVGAKSKVLQDPEDLEEYEDEVTELVSEDGDSEGMDEQDGEDGDSEEESGDEEDDEEDEEDSVYDSADDEEGVAAGSDDDDEDDDDDDESFEDQGSSSDESETMERQALDDEEDEEGEGDILYLDSEDEEGAAAESAIVGDGRDDAKPRQWKSITGLEREKLIEEEKKSGALAVAKYMHTDDLSSDDEKGGNTIGRVPLHWCEEFEHIGYNAKGEKVMKSKKADGLEQAIASRDDPNYYRTVYDAVNDRTVVLSDRDLEVIRRIQKGAFAHPEHDAYPNQIDVFCAEQDIFGSAAPEPKRRFLPSKWERMKVMKLVKAIKEGRIKVLRPGEVDEEAEEKKRQAEFYMLWKDEDDEETKRKGPRHISAPKIPLPGHAESYNPPEEYLFTAEEEKEWHEMDPSDRPLNFIPRKFNSLRQVAGYKDFVKERFERCLDLYLCPRAIKKNVDVDPDSLLPKLPNPKDLRPFPTTKAIEFEGHSGRVRTMSVSVDGQYLVTGSDDNTVRLWEVSSGYCMECWDVGASVVKVAFNPNPAHHVVAVAAGSSVFLIATNTGSADAMDITHALLASGLEGSGVTTKGAENLGVKWEGKANKGWDAKSRCLVLRLPAPVTSLVWHHKGDYLGTVMPSAASKAVMIHQVSKGKTQCPFRKTHGQVQVLSFHPSKPFFFVATQTHVRVYHLLKQMLVKKLITGCKWISCIDVHPTGDHVLVSSYDRRVVWFDLDLSSMPYKTLKYHTKAVRGVQFHRRYPLMASCSDDGAVHVFHSMVYDDLMRNPLIVPVKILRGHEVVGDIGVMDLAFHPTQPWLFSAGADHKVFLYQDLF